jgi:hypothetical protein
MFQRDVSFDLLEKYTGKCRQFAGVIQPDGLVAYNSTFAHKT